MIAKKRKLKLQHAEKQVAHNGFRLGEELVFEKRQAWNRGSIYK
jgi:hypothetical protein